MRKIAALLIANLLALPVIAFAQGKGRADTQLVQPAQIDPAEGARILEAFRHARTQGDYSFAFKLVNRPKDGEETEVYGHMWGTWDDEGRALNRVDLALPGAHTLHLIYRGGADGRILRSLDDGKAVEITGEERFKPILDGTTFTPFDLQMPFLFWTDYKYEGTKKLIGRNAHYFLLTPPAGFEGKEVRSVRVAIDADFMVMLYAEELGKGEKSVKAFRINDFAKTDGQWIVKEIDLVDAATKNRTRFKVIDAWLGLNLPPETFKPDTDGVIKDANNNAYPQVGN
jgi:hypothetical protein